MIIVMMSTIILTALNFPSIAADGMRHIITEQKMETPQAGRKMNLKISIICLLLMMLFKLVLKEGEK